MKRIITWISATLVAAALVITFQVNLSGGEKTDGDRAPTSSATSSASCAPKTSDTPADVTCGTGEDANVGKPGETEK